MLPTKHIIILSTQRAGSSALASAIVNKLGYESKMEPLIDSMNLTQAAIVFQELLSKRDERIVLLIKWDQILRILNISSEELTCLSDVFENLAAHPVGEYLTSPHLGRFILKRNPLHSLVSAQKAKLRGLWHAGPEDIIIPLNEHEISEYKVPLSEIIDFLNYFNSGEKLEQYFQSFLDYSVLSYESLLYEDLRIPFVLDGKEIRVGFSDSSLKKLN